MKSKQLLLLVTLFISGVITAQVKIAPKATTTTTNVTRMKTTLSAKDIKTIPLKFEAGPNYSIWKNGYFISPNNLGGEDQMFTTYVNDSWSVGYAGYNLLPKNGAVTISVRVQNRKKYMVTVHYSTGSYLKMEAQMQYSSANPKDYNLNSTHETLEFTPDKKWPGTFSFIIEPEINKLGGGDIAEGYAVNALIQLSIPDVKMSESGKSSKDYYLNYLGMDIKEIQ
jgi:hypothetical protein